MLHSLLILTIFVFYTGDPLPDYGDSVADGPFGAAHPVTQSHFTGVDESGHKRAYLGTDSHFKYKVDASHPKPPYKAGDKVGLLIDLSKGSMAAYLNDQFQFETTGIPTAAPLHIFAVVDRGNDRIELLPIRAPPSHMQAAGNTVALPEPTAAAASGAGGL